MYWILQSKTDTGTFKLKHDSVLQYMSKRALCFQLDIFIVILRSIAANAAIASWAKFKEKPT